MHQKALPYKLRKKQNQLELYMLTFRYLIMDAQLNIQNGTYVSAVYQINKMFMKEPHTALFVAPTGVGKTHLALSLLETEYINHFDFIVIFCPT